LHRFFFVRNREEIVVIRVLWLAPLFLVAGSANAALIFQDRITTSIALPNHGPIAQSFVAEDPLVTFGFYFTRHGATDPNELLQLRILSGDGLNGAQVGTFAFTPLIDSLGFWDTDMSSIVLTIGQTYTVVLDQADSYWAVALADNTGTYGAGRAFFNENPEWHFVSDNSDDFVFRVAPVGAILETNPALVLAAPEPGGIALFAVGLLGMCALHKRRSRNPSLAT
jgi:hypothetical protein